MHPLYSTIVTIAWILMAVSMAHVAKGKNRSSIAWFLLGIFFGALGLVLLLLLPAKPASSKRKQKRAKATASGLRELHQEAALPSEDGGESSFDQPQNLKRIPGSKGIKWYFIDSSSPDHKVLGPMEITDLRKAIHEKKLDDATYIWCEHFEDWAQINEFSNRSLLLDKDFLEEH